MGRLSREQSESATGPVVITYEPKEFPKVMSEPAKDFVSSQNKVVGGAFKIDPLIADRTGVAQVKAEALQREIERQALIRLKDVQEKAYQEAFELGLVEGTEKAFEERKAEVISRLNYLDSFIRTIEDLKTRLLQENESQIVSLIFQLGKSLALREITENRDAVLNVIKSIMEEVQSDERIIIRVSQEDYDFIQGLKKAQAKEVESISKVKLEVDPQVTSGGCLLDTNFGSIDASIEQRVAKAFDTLRARAPKIQPTEIESLKQLPTKDSEPEEIQAAEELSELDELNNALNELEESNKSTDDDSGDSENG